MNEEIFEASLSPQVKEQLSRDSSFAAVHKKAANLTERMKSRPFDLDKVWKMMDGAIDMHIHGGPEAYTTRLYDELEIAIQACQVGMQAIAFKCHSSPTTRSINIVQKVVAQWAAEHNRKKTDVFGGVVLNYEVGGLNPAAVAASIAMGGKIVWTPSRDSSHHYRVTGKTGGIAVLDDNDHVVPPLMEIFSLIAAGDAVLSLTHQSTKERLILIEEAKKAGVQRIEVAHPMDAVTRMTVEQMKMAADKGAYLGMYCFDFMPSHWSWELFMETVKKVGSDRIIAATDSGHYQFARPVDLFRLYITGMLEHGVSAQDVEKMVKTNARNLLY